MGHNDPFSQSFANCAYSATAYQCRILRRFLKSSVEARLDSKTQFSQFSQFILSNIVTTTKPFQLQTKISS
jgi:hypothetical protein